MLPVTTKNKEVTSRQSTFANFKTKILHFFCSKVSTSKNGHTLSWLVQTIKSTKSGLGWSCASSAMTRWNSKTKLVGCYFFLLYSTPSNLNSVLFWTSTSHEAVDWANFVLPQSLPRKQQPTSRSCRSVAFQSRHLCWAPPSARPCPRPTPSCWCSTEQTRWLRPPSDSSISPLSRSSSHQWRRVPSSSQALLK